MKNLPINLFGLINEIEPAHPDTWDQRIFLTFDIDWACDFVLEDTISLLEKSDVAATWFVTHQTSLLDRLRSNPKFELGIHPNFNELLSGKSATVNASSAEHILDELLTIVPEAKSVRSHSMLQSSRLYDLFAKRALTHECNNYIPSESKTILRPWKTWQGLTKVTHFWEDDLNTIGMHVDATSLAQEHAGLRVFDFHPIHLYLNTETLTRYEQSRSDHANASNLITWRSNSPTGARAQLERLLSSASQV